MQKKILMFLLLLCGCQPTIQVPVDFAYKEIKTDKFTLASWQKITHPKAPFKIYVEGDGAAFTGDGRPSMNPTPKGTLLREIAFGDEHENVVYLARPCQFVKDAQCEQKYWTTARFAPEVISSTVQAIRTISGGQELVLVGFSGGAQVAGLAAVTKKGLNVQKMVTLGGNFDHLAWTRHHHLPPLKESLNLADYRDLYAQIPQRHFVGEKDKNILPFLVKDFVPEGTMTIVNGATHNQGWDKMYEAIRRE